MADSVHPLVALVTDSLAHGATEPFALPDEGLAKLRRAFEPLLGTKELPLATRELAIFAGYLANEKKSPGAALRIGEVLVLALPALRGMVGEHAQKVSAQVEAQQRQLKKKAMGPPGGSGLPID